MSEGEVSPRSVSSLFYFETRRVEIRICSSLSFSLYADVSSLAVRKEELEAAGEHTLRGFLTYHPEGG